VDDAVARLNDASPSAEAPVLGVPDSWATRIQQVAAGELGTEQALAAVDSSGLLDLVRDREALIAVTGGIENAASTGGSGPVLDVTLELLRRLQEAIPERERSRLRELRLGMLRLWALEDESGDQTLAGDVVDEVERLLEVGCSTTEYEEVVELLALRWVPFLSDLAFGLGVRTLEVLAAGRPMASNSLGSFATPLLARVTRANVDRLDLADLLVAETLSGELHLGLSLLELRAKQESATQEFSGWAGMIGIYSLDENALDRTAVAVRSLLPQADVRTIHDKVSSAPLRSLAANADLMVVATQKAKHAATDAIGAARGAGEVTYSNGRGSSSLVRTIIEAVQSQLTVA